MNTDTLNRICLFRPHYLSRQVASVACAFEVSVPRSSTSSKSSSEPACIKEVTCEDTAIDMQTLN